MTSGDSQALAEAMIRFHGLEQALAMASRYAADEGAKNDICAQAKWRVVAARIVLMIENAQQLKRYNEMRAARADSTGMPRPRPL